VEQQGSAFARQCCRHRFKEPILNSGDYIRVKLRLLRREYRPSPCGPVACEDGPADAAHSRIRRRMTKGKIPRYSLKRDKAWERIMSDPEIHDQSFICTTCGTQFPPSARPPSACATCADPRQYIGLDGQQWTTLPEMRRKHSNVIQPEEAGVYSIYTEPTFAIGQRALLVQTPAGNVLWDCITFLDQPTIDAIRNLGGVAAIAISHPHYYSSMVEWSERFGDAPIYLHAADQPCVLRPHPNIRFWSGNRKTLLHDLVLINTPGHFDGFQVLHWPGGANGKGALFSGDQPQVCMDTRWVTFMYSYPNFIPLNAGAIERIVATLEPYAFDRIYGAFAKRTVAVQAKEAVRRSADRFIRAMQ
jgi:hypothetical protein